jgi:uncharacterized protein
MTDDFTRGATALRCPKCDAPMRTYERNGVHLDRCTECGGLFLDRGELERLIDAEAGYYSGSPRAGVPPARDRYPDERRPASGWRDDRGWDDDDDDRRGGRRRGGFLEDLLDFG